MADSGDSIFEILRQKEALLCTIWWLTSVHVVMGFSKIFSSLPGFSIPGDVSGSDKYYAEDLIDPPIRAVDGCITLPKLPGLGYAAMEDRIQRHTTRTASLI